MSCEADRVHSQAGGDSGRGAAMRYRFFLENSAEARRLIWEGMEAEGITRTILWNRVRPVYADWRETLAPETTLLGLIYKPKRSEPDGCHAREHGGEGGAVTRLPRPAPTPPEAVRQGQAALVGAFWIVPYGRCGTCHFVIFRAWRKDALRIGREALRTMFARWNFASLLASYPAPYRQVRAFVSALGFEPLGRLPGACPMPTRARPERCRDMALARLCRGEA